jgi:hypothetical protein
MEIFNKHIFGTDADSWLKQCKEYKKEWILKHTNQTDEKVIDEFVNNPKISKECKCLDCGNKRKSIPAKIKVDNDINSASGDGKRGTNKRRKDSKTS